MLRNIFLSFLLLLQHASADYVDLTFDEFVQGVDEGRFNVLADVRTSREFETGHIPQSTLLENLASFGNAAQVSTPADLIGCEICPIVVFDSSGARARTALEFLVEAGFTNLYLFEGGTDAWDLQRLELETGSSSVVPPCTDDETMSTICFDLTELSVPSPSPPVVTTTLPTYGRLDDSRRLSAKEFLRMKDNGEVGIIMDVREDWSKGHIPGATLVGLLSFDNVEEKVASFDTCFRCSVVVYGELAASAIVTLRAYGFASHLYEGPSVQEWEETGNGLVTDESMEPACLNDGSAQFACEQQWLSFQNMPFVTPTDPPTILTTVPTSAPLTTLTMVPTSFTLSETAIPSTNSSTNAAIPTSVDSVLSSGANRWSVTLGGLLVLSCLSAVML